MSNSRRAVRQTGSVDQLLQQWHSPAAAADAAMGLESLPGEAKVSAQKSPEDLLIDMLATAVQLEFATIPPYLCALWSIKDDRHPVANSIREVVQEEMLHLALTCNLLAAFDVEFKLSELAPKFPGHLPGKVHPQLEVDLRGLDDAALLGFVTIESPVALPQNVVPEGTEPPLPTGGHTIGELYETILAAFRRLKPELKVDRQVTGPLSWKVIATLAEVEGAIRLIQHQGEGAIIEPLDSGFDDLAHYYRFLEVLKQKRLVYDKGERKYFWQGSFPRPETWPMAPTKDWEKEIPTSGKIFELLERFDAIYSKMLRMLDRTWQLGGQGALIKAIDLMFELEKYAKPLMQEKLPNRPPAIAEKPAPTYGPLFRYRPE